MAFDLASVLADVSDSGTGREQIEYIRLDLIDSDPNNFYQLSEVDKLADNISLCGLQQPIRVRQQTDPDKNGRYMIVSGHRRRAAIELLAKDAPDRWQEVPCIVERDTASPALQQLRLIYANSDTRKISSADLMEQAAQVEKLLYQLKEEGYEFPGRMRDHVAQAVKASKTKLARLKMIRDNLSNCWMQYYKKNVLSENTAYTLAQMSAEDQRLIFDVKKKDGKDIKYLYADNIETYVKRFKEIEKLKCKRRGREVACQNVYNKKCRAASLDRWYNCSCGKCCSSCNDLASCKYACPVMADKIKRIKSDKREANKQAKLAQEEKDRPKIESLRLLWDRFAAARVQAKKSVKEFYEAVGMYYTSTSPKEVQQLESGEAKIGASTRTPFGYNIRLTEVDMLVKAADLFDCSIDYLLGRTDIREMASPEVAMPDATMIWHPISEEPPAGVDLIWVDNRGYCDTAKYMGFQKISIVSTISRDEARYWAYPPDYLEKEIENGK